MSRRDENRRVDQTHAQDDGEKLFDTVHCFLLYQSRKMPAAPRHLFLSMAPKALGRNPGRVQLNARAEFSLAIKLQEFP
jgi:hypothetical protein